MGFAAPWILGGTGTAGGAGLCAPAAAAREHTTAGQFAHVLRAGNSEFHASPSAQVPAVICTTLRACSAHRAGLRESLHTPGRGKNERSFAADRA